MQIFSNKKGFTLIELLVVIAIIGILAGIVLVSLSGAQKRAKDGRIMTDMNQLRTTAQVFYDNHSYTYTGLGADTDEDKIAADIAAQGGTYSLLINVNGLGYCATSSLPGAGGYWCIDATLKSEKDGDGTLTACVEACAAANTCACD